MKANHLKKSKTALTARLMGAGLILASVAGFFLNIPQQTSAAELGSDPASNTLYLLSGLAGLFAGSCGKQTSRIYFRCCGAVYGVLAAMAFVYLDQSNFGWLTNDAAHALFHFSVAVFSLLFGFGNFSLVTPAVPIRVAHHHPHHHHSRERFHHAHHPLVHH